MRAITKARARITSSRQLVPRVFNAPYGGAAYFAQAYKWEQVLHLKYWFGLGIRYLQREIAGGEGPMFGEISRKEDAEQKVLKRCKKLKYTPAQSQAELHRHRCAQDRLRRRAYAPHNKALGGPKPHEEFEAWDDDHPIVKLFDLPNMLDTAYDLWSFSTLFFYLTGECHWWVMRNQFGVPVEIWVIPTHWMRMVTGRDGMPEAWAIQSPWGTLQYAPYDDVLSFWDHSPLNRYEGWGVSLMCSEWLDAYEANVRARLAQFKNGAIPAFHVALSDEYVDPDEAMLNRLYSKWFARFRGEDNTGQPVITGPGVEIKPLGISPVDMGYAQMDDQMRDNILAALGVPKGVLGLEPTSDVSAYAPQRAAARFTINPRLGMFAQRVTHGLIRRTPNCEHGTMFWYDRVVDDPEQDMREMQFEAANGAGTPNEWRTRLGKEPYPFGGDDPVLNGQIMPWATGEQPRQDQELAASYSRALRGQLAADEAPTPAVVDKDEESPGVPEPLLRWHRTYEGHLEAAGKKGRWMIERSRGPDGKVAYRLLRQGKPVDQAMACSLLKQIAEQEEQKSLSAATGQAGGYLVPAQVQSPEPKNFGQRFVPYSTPGGHSGPDAGFALPPEGVTIEERQRLNDEISSILHRRGLILGRSGECGRNMVIGNGRA